MPDWNQLVRERLGVLGIAPQLEEEVVAELAGHLEDRCTSAVNRGMTEPEAVALEEVPDWVALNKEIIAAKKEEPMNERTKILWLPGLTMAFCSAVLLPAMSRLVPPAVWADRRAPVLLFALWVLSYVVIGALGAYWSRRAGASIAVRFLSGVFPVGLHLAILISGIVVTSLQAAPRFPEHLQLSFLWRAGIVWVVIPGVALALGTLPFLRNHSREGSRVSA